VAGNPRTRWTRAIRQCFSYPVPTLLMAGPVCLRGVAGLKEGAALSRQCGRKPHPCSSDRAVQLSPACVSFHPITTTPVYPLPACISSNNSLTVFILTGFVKNKSTPLAVASSPLTSLRRPVSATILLRGTSQAVSSCRISLVA